jgi:hypothetical protein
MAEERGMLKLKETEIGGSWAVDYRLAHDWALG